MNRLDSLSGNDDRVLSGRNFYDFPGIKSYLSGYWHSIYGCALFISGNQREHPHCLLIRHCGDGPMGITPFCNPWLFGLYRFLDSCLGILVAVIIAHLLWPLKISQKIGRAYRKPWHHLSEMYRASIKTEALI